MRSVLLWIVGIGLAIGMTIFLLPGCGNSLPPQADANQARVVLQEALESWQKGETIDSLAQRTPPIYFNDPKCIPGIKLVSFQIEDGHENHGQSVRISASLSLTLKDGTKKEKKYRYLIDTSPTVVIVPD
jgi:hypothetical protein